MYKTKSFRRTLFLGFMLSTFLPLICLGYVSYFYLEFKISEFSNQRDSLLADTVSTEISSYLRNPLVAVRQVSVLFKSAKLTNAEKDDVLNTVVWESDYLESIYVIDEQKRIVNIGLDEGYRSIGSNYLGMDLSGLSILKNIEFLQGPYWSNSFLSPVSGNKSLALIYPMENQNYLIGLINIEYLHGSIAARSGRRDMSIIILDDDGGPVFHPQLNIVEEQMNFANILPYKEAQLGIFGTYEFLLNNTKFIGSTSIIPETKWLVMVIQPIAVANRPLWSMTKFFGIAALFSVLVVVIMAIRQSQRLIRPLNDLQKNIQAVADGDYQADISQQSHVEFEKVATHFRHMATAIERREQLLEVNEERLVSLLEVHNLKELSESELLAFALEQAVSLTRSEIGYLHLLGENEKSINSTFWSNNAADFCSRYGISSNDLSMFDFGRKSIVERKHIIANLQSKVGGNTPGVVELTIMRQLSVPIFDGARIVAVVGVLNKENIYDRTDARQLSLYFNHTWDILQQKRYERDRTRLAEQLAHAQKLEAIGTLAGGIAHDFNNVLMVIIGNTELAKDNINKPEKIQQDLDQIFKAALRARDLVNQILAFSRDKAEGLKPLDIKPIVKEAVKLLRSSIPANIGVRPDIAQESYPVVSEPGQINQIIMNLSTNAYQSMSGKGGELTIGLSPMVLEEDLFFRGELVVAAGEYMVFAVKDSGKGIPDDMINRIFEPYFTTREKEQGTGLGLAVVHGIVKGLKGGITVESELGKGSTFKVYLPVATSESKSEEMVISGSLPGGNERILYVDDDESVARVNKRILESLGYKVSMYLSSRSAHSEFQKHPDEYDLLITDMAMPEITGDALAKMILEINADIPVLLCTGFSDSLDDEKAKEIGIAEVMMKPVTKMDLALTVRKILGFGKNFQ